MHFDRRLWAFTRGLRGWIAAAILMGLIASVIGIARFVLLGVLLSQVFRGAGWAAVALPAVGVAAAVILRGWIEQQRAMVSHRTADRVQQNLRGRLYDKIAELGPAWFAGERTGGVMLSIVDGVEQLQSFFGQYVPQLSIAVLTPLAIFVFIAFWDVPVAAVMLAFALFTLIAPAVFLQNERRSSHDRQQTLKAFGSEFLDGVQGLPTLKAFGQSTAYGRRLAARAGELCTSTLRVLGFSVMTRGITDCGVAVGAAAALALGVWRVSHGEMSLQALLIVLMAGTEIFRPLRDLRTVLHQGMVGQSAGAGINALLAAEPLVPPRPASPAPSVALAPTIAFEDVHFAYPGGRGAAHDGVSFNVAAGEQIGIVGPSGSGKSSVARLLLRLFDPQQGRVLIGGRDLKTLDPDRARRMIAVVHQDTYLFHGTVEENLRLGRPDADQQELEAAARDANAHEFIAALPQGYRTMIGERGVMLSGGQRQRLAIARALLRDAPILILDEALSSVDAENEAVIQQAIDRLSAGRTTLILAHRLSSVIGADRILVLDQGRIVEAGRHAELIRRDGPYRRLMGAQAEDREDDAVLATAGDAAPDITEEREQLGTAFKTGVAETAPAELAAAAASVGWAATLGTLLRIIGPWRRRLAIVAVSGIASVAA
ncbi:MAG: ABC transporter ATP-binding protein/permease, partial [Stellaceae bacterium]